MATFDILFEMGHETKYTTKACDMIFIFQFMKYLRAFCKIEEINSKRHVTLCFLPDVIKGSTPTPATHHHPFSHKVALSLSL